MDAHLGYKKNDDFKNNSCNSRNGSFPKVIQTEHGESTILYPEKGRGSLTPLSSPNIRDEASQSKNL